MQVNLPPKARLAVYILFGVGSLVVTYLLDKGQIGAEEVKFFTGLSAFAYALAAINVNGIK